MNKKEKFSFLKGKGASVGIVLCFVAVIAMVGTVTFRNYKKNMNEQIAKVQQETEKLTKENDAAANSKDVLPMRGRCNTVTDRSCGSSGTRRSILHRRNRGRKWTAAGSGDG